MRARVRRKRKKPGHRLKNELGRRVVRLLVKYWTVLIFLPAAVLLVYEGSRIGKRPSLVVDSEHREVKQPSLEVKSELSKNPSLEKKSEGKLNQLDPTTRVVGGFRERCLKLLPPEELEHLDIPVGEESTSPIEKVLYKSENDTPYVGRSIILSQQRIEATRINLFTGNQSLDLRENSFKVNETAVIHCGFYSENGVLRFRTRTKITWKLAKLWCLLAHLVVEMIYQPIGMSEASLRKVCYVAFWDDITLAAQDSEGRKIGEDRLLGNGALWLLGIFLS